MRNRTAAFAALAALLLLAQMARDAAAAPPPPIQGFDVSGAFAPDETICFGGARPPTPLAPIGTNPCGAGSSDSAVPAGTTLAAYSVDRIPPGARLSQAVSIAPPAWTLATYPCAPADASNACNGGDKGSQAISGNVYSETNVFCHNISTSPSNVDILADPSSTPPNFQPFTFRRTAQEAGVNGGAGALAPGNEYSYIEQIQPFPASFTFVAQDSADLTGLFLGGAAPAFPLAPPVPLIEYTRRASWGTGAAFTFVQPAGDPTPPDDRYICNDGPQNSIVETAVTTPATPGIYPRIALYTSAPDIVGREVTRIIDLQCVRVGTFTVNDDDHDCLQDAAAGGTDADDTNPDQDGDLLVDGIEAAVGTPVNAADQDADGATDYDEVFQYTNPAVADTDGDGSKDKRDDGSDEVPGGAVNDTTNDDNCPTVANASQLNTDAGPTYHGTVNSPATGDATNPAEDTLGDACDPDKDNDGIDDVAEAGMLIVPWTGFSGTATTVCRGAGSGGSPPAVAMNPLDGDEDRDLYLSGVECMQRARPDIADKTVASCSTSPVDADGCAQPGPPTPGGDLDGDGLYMPGAGSGMATNVEVFYRVQSVVTGVNSLTNDIENCPAGMCKASACGPDGLIGATNDKDSDCDALGDGAEVNFYGTSPAAPDTDGDGCSDGREAADVSGDFNVTASDLGLVASKFGGYRAGNGTIAPGAAYGKVNFDFNKDGNITASDLGSVASYFGSCGSKGALPITRLYKVAPDN